MSILKKEDWALEIWIWQNDNLGSFNSQLMDLISKADRSNQFLLSQAYPVAVDTYLEWYRSTTPEAYYNLFEKTRRAMKLGSARVLTIS